MNFFNLLFLGKYGNYHKTNWYEALFAKVVGAGKKLIAKFLKIKGNTIVWNQLNNNSGESGDKNGVTFTNNNDGSWTIIGTTSATNTFRNINYTTLPLTYIKDHIYLITGATSTCNIRLYNDGTGKTTFNSDTIFKADSSPSAVYTRWQIYPNNTGVAVNETVIHMYFDLTKMFGQTKAEEILAMGQTDGVAYFRSLFPLPFYSYEQGKLLSFNGEGIKTVGKNLLKTNDSLSWSAPSLTKNEDGSIYVQGSRTSNGAYTIGNITLLANKTYTLKKTGSGDLYFRLEQDGTTLTTGGLTDGTYTPTQNIDCTVRIFARGNINYDFTIYPQIELGSISSDYEPYTENTTSLPTLTYFPTGMKSAGSIYDELSNNKAITRIGEVDLGSLEWTRRSSTVSGVTIYRFTANVNGLKLAPVRTVPMVCKLYRNITDGSSLQATWDKVVYNNGDSIIIFISDNDYTDTTTFKQAMSGVMLYYELEAPTEVDIDPPLKLNYQVWEGGTEQLLPVNTDVPVTSPILADIKYPDGERDDQYFTYRQYLPNSRMMSMALNTIMGKSVEFNQEALDILMKGE